MAAKGDRKPGRVCARSMPLNYDKHMPHIELSGFYNTNIFLLLLLIVYIKFVMHVN